MHGVAPRVLHFSAFILVAEVSLVAGVALVVDVALVTGVAISS